jgi:hypothetical protein
MSDKANPGGEYRGALFRKRIERNASIFSFTGRRADERGRFQRAPLCRARLGRDNGPEMKLRFDAGHF